MRKSKNFASSPFKGNSKNIKCECGLEILLIPDLAEMGLVIELHAKKHQENASTIKEGKKIFNHIQDLLLKQVLEKASLKENNRT